MIEFSKICLRQNSIFENFEITRIVFYKICEIFVLQRTQREHMITLEMEDGREAS